MKAWQPSPHQLIVTVHPHWFYWLAAPLLMFVCLILPVLGIGLLIVHTWLHPSTEWSLADFALALGGLLLVLLWIAAFGGLILVVLANREWLHCEFNRHTGMMTLHRRRPVGAKLIRHPLDRIKWVRVQHWQETRSSQSSVSNWKEYYTVKNWQVLLEIQDAKNVPLTTYSQRNPREPNQVAGQIQRFLGLG